jgi:thiol-disulfide isomerase/thioredoxin
VAKTSAAKRRPAPNKAPNRAPAKGGRPAGLFTWIAVGLVVVVVVALGVIKITSGGPPKTPSSSTFQPINPGVLTELTTIPASVFNTVGVTSPIAGVDPPQAVAKQPALTAINSAGASVPEVLYMGAEYCPYCAAQRWTTIIALSRFGTWSGLGNMSSYSNDVYPNTPTFTFVKASYKSKYLVFKSVEEYTNYLDKAGTYYAPLQKPTGQELGLITKYDTPKYIKGLTASEAGSIPFIDYGNQYLVAGASYSPSTLTGSSRNEIAGALSNSSSPITDAIITSANYQTAVICKMTKNQPGNVCMSSGVQAAAKAMGIK